MNKLFLIAAAVMVAASGMMLHSVSEIQSTVRLNPELERLAIAYLRDQEQRREYARKVDQANWAAEQNLKLPLDLPPVQLNFDTAPKTSPHVKPSK